MNKTKQKTNATKINKGENKMNNTIVGKIYEEKVIIFKDEVKDWVSYGWTEYTEVISPDGGMVLVPTEEADTWYEKEVERIKELEKEMEKYKKVDFQKWENAFLDRQSRAIEPLEPISKEDYLDVLYMQEVAYEEVSGPF